VCIVSKEVAYKFIFFKAFRFLIFISLTVPPKREMMIMKITLQIRLGF